MECVDQEVCNYYIFILYICRTLVEAISDYIVLHVLCSTRTSGGHFRPSEVRFRAFCAVSGDYFIKQKTSQNRAKIPLNLTSEGLKYPPEVRLQHETRSTICGTHVQAILNQKHRKNCECCPGHYLSTSVY